MKTGKLLFILITTVLAFSSCANTQQVSQIAEKQKIIESRLIAVEQNKYQAAKNFKDEVEQLRQYVKDELSRYQKTHLFYLDELDQLKEDLMTMTNLDEQNRYKARNIRTRIKRLEARISAQEIALESMMNFLKEDPKPLEKATTKSDKAYQKAYLTYKDRKLGEALKLFKQFRNTYPKDKKQDSALFYTGYIQFLQGRYEGASLSFHEFRQLFPKSSKYNESNWWLGVSLERTGDIKGAIQIYRELVKLKKNNPLRIKAEYRLDQLELPEG